MRFTQLAIVLFIALFGVHCGSGATGEEDVDAPSRLGNASLAQACVAEWDPAWAQGSGANEWWIEYAITGGIATSAYLEIVGVRNVPLTFNWNKWVGSTPRITRGTNVIVHATRQGGDTAQTEAFSYLVDTQPDTACGAPLCGDGTCDASESCSTCEVDCGSCPTCKLVGEACGECCPGLGLGCCNGSCVELYASEAHCGGCNNACEPGVTTCSDCIGAVPACIPIGACAE